MKTYKNHIYGDHMNLPRTASAYQFPRIYEAANRLDYEDSGEEDMEQNSIDQHLNDTTPKEFKSFIANWILRIRECCKVTQATMEEIVQRVTDLIQFILSRLCSAVMTTIRNANIDAGIVSSIHELFDLNGHFGRPFKDLETTSQQLQYCKKNLGFVVSMLNNSPPHQHSKHLVLSM